MLDNGGFQYDRNQTTLIIKGTSQIIKRRFTFSSFVHLKLNIYFSSGVKPEREDNYDTGRNHEITMGVH